MKKYIKVLEFILKSLLVVSVLFIIYGVVRFVFSIVSESVNVPEGDAITLFWPFICAAVVFVLFQCLMFIFIRVVKSNGDNPNELKLFSKIRIDSYSAIFGNFENIKSSIIEYAKNNKYKEYAFDLVVNHNELYILEKKSLGDNLAVFIPGYTDELNDSFLCDLNDIFSQFLKERRFKFDRLSVSTLICVNHNSPALQEFLNDKGAIHVWQSEIRAGYSFEEKTLYVEKPSSSSGAAQQKKMRNFLFEALPEQVKIKNHSFE